MTPLYLTILCFILIVYVYSAHFQCSIYSSWTIFCLILCCTVFSLVPNLVLTVFLAFLSVFMTLAQPLFQISLATGYDDEIDPCKASM